MSPDKGEGIFVIVGSEQESPGRHSAPQGPPHVDVEQRTWSQLAIASLVDVIEDLPM